MKKSLFALILLALFGGGFWYFKSPDKAPQIPSTTVRKQDLNIYVNAIGKVYANNQVLVATLANGEIKQMRIKQGDMLQKGDVIAVLDDVAERSALDNARANLAHLEDEIQRAKAAHKLAKKLLDDAQKLSKIGGRSENELLEKQERFAAASAQLSAAIAQKTTALNNIKTLEKALDDTIVRAPISGIAISVDAREGQTINSRLNSPVLARIADVSRFEVRMKIPQNEVNKLKVNQAVSASLLSGEENFSAHLAAIDDADVASVDGQGQSAVHYYARYFLDAAKTNGRIKIGMHLQNQIHINSVKDALVLPISFILQDENGHFVWAKRGENLQKVRITLGQSDDVLVQIFGDIKAGEEVFLND